MADSLADACSVAPLCPVPERIVASHWAGHLPFAFWLAHVLRPRLFVELGAYAGMSFCAFCQAMQASGHVCEAYAVDLWQGDAHMGEYGEEVYNDLAAHVRQRYGHFASLLRMSFDAARPQFSPGTVDLLHLDGCHEGDAILHDFHLWLPVMSSRGIILIHDVCARLPGYGGVGAWDSIREKFATFTFRHGYGLGVVVAGKDAPQMLRDMCSLAPQDQENLAGKFQAQGRVYDRLVAQEERRVREQAQSAHSLMDLHGQMERLREIVAQERSQHMLECETLKEKLLAAELRGNAYADSLSWKITAPLRKLAACLRKAS